MWKTIEFVMVFQCLNSKTLNLVYFNHLFFTNGVGLTISGLSRKM